MKAVDVMSLGAATIRSDASVAEAARLMLEYRISGLPVVDAADNLVGIVTEGDFLRRLEAGTERRRPRWLELFVGSERLADEYVHSRSRKVEDVMTRTVVTTTEDRPVEEVVELMERHRIKRVPVVRERKIIGIVSRANFLRAVARLADEAPALSASDEEIRKKIMTELGNQGWGKDASINVFVQNGIVHLSGIIFDQRKRQAWRVAAENVPGVKSVEDRTIWIDSSSGEALE